jgi:hypothetical protein
VVSVTASDGRLRVRLKGSDAVWSFKRRLGVGLVGLVLAVLSGCRCCSTAARRGPPLEAPAPEPLTVVEFRP